MATYWREKRQLRITVWRFGFRVWNVRRWGIEKGILTFALNSGYLSFWFNYRRWV